MTAAVAPRPGDPTSFRVRGVRIAGVVAAVDEAGQRALVEYTSGLARGATRTLVELTALEPPEPAPAP